MLLVASWDVKEASSFSVLATRRFLRRVNPDIVVVNNAGLEPIEQLAENLGYKYTAQETAQKGVLFPIVLSKLPLHREQVFVSDSGGHAQYWVNGVYSQLHLFGCAYRYNNSTETRITASMLGGLSSEHGALLLGNFPFDPGNNFEPYSQLGRFVTNTQGSWVKQDMEEKQREEEVNMFEEHKPSGVVVSKVWYRGGGSYKLADKGTMHWVRIAESVFAGRQDRL